MPRISVCLNRDDPGENFENENVDICQDCVYWIFDRQPAVLRRLVEAGRITEAELQADVKDFDENGGSEHPPYELEAMTCQGCDFALTAEDN